MTPACSARWRERSKRRRDGGDLRLWVDQFLLWFVLQVRIAGAIKEHEGVRHGPAISARIARHWRMQYCMTDCGIDCNSHKRGLQQRCPPVIGHRATKVPRITPLEPFEYRTLHCLLALIAAVFGMSPAGAAVPLRQSQQPIANFAFASQLGAGVYSVDGRAVQIYRLPFHWELRPPTQERMGLDITLPVTLGFYGYHVEHVVTEGLPKSVDTYSFLPGLEVSRLVGAQWRVATFVEAGVATVHAGSSHSFIYATGLRARYDFRMGDVFYTRYATELLYAGSQVPEQVKDTMTRLSNGIDALHRTTMSMRGETVDFGPYLLSEWYLKRPTAPAPSSGPPMAAVQWEVGVTVGTVYTSYLWKIPIPRIGIGYRFGSDLSIVRLVFGSAF